MTDLIEFAESASRGGEWLSVDEYARRMQLAPATVRAACKRAELVHARAGRQFRVWYETPSAGVQLSADEWRALCELLGVSANAKTRFVDAVHATTRELAELRSRQLRLLPLPVPRVLDAAQQVVRTWAELENAMEDDRHPTMDKLATGLRAMQQRVAVLASLVEVTP